MYEIDKQKIRELVAEHGGARVVIVPTLRKGRAMCINPVPTICGPTVHCREEDFSEVRRLVEQAAIERLNE